MAHDILIVLADIRREGQVMTYLRPDAKSQVSVEYDDNGRARRIDTIVVSTQHDEFITAEEAGSQAEADRRMLAQIRKDVIEILIPPRSPRTSEHPRNQSAFRAERHHLHVNPPANS